MSEESNKKRIRRQDMKLDFVRKVRLRLLDLEEKRGLFRKEATNVVLRELCCSTSSVSIDRVSKLMKKYSLSEENARRALLVQAEFKVRFRLIASSSLISLTNKNRTSQIIKSRGVDCVRAIELLTKRIESASPVSSNVVTTTTTSTSTSHTKKKKKLSPQSSNKKKKRKRRIDSPQPKNGGDSEISSDDSSSVPSKRICIELVKSNSAKNSKATALSKKKRAVATKKLDLDMPPGGGGEDNKGGVDTTAT